MYKISPSLLDKFSSIRAGLFDKPVEELIAYIKGEGITTDQMQFGTKVHKYFETGESLLHPKEIEQLKPFYELNKNYPKEIRARVELFPEIIISFVADQLIGNIVHEFKTGERFWGVDLYDNSPQWKVYCLGFESPMVVYHHFQYTRYANNDYASFNYSRFSFMAYSGMKDEIKRLIDDFIDFVQLNNLEKYILI